MRAMCSFRERISPVSSATMREATSCGQSNALGSGCAKYLVHYVCGPFDATVSEVGSDALVARSRHYWAPF
jgi:hypothetical protein